MTGMMLVLPNLPGLGWIPMFAGSGQISDQYPCLSLFSYTSGLLLHLVEGVVFIVWQGRDSPDWFGEHRTFV